MHVLSPSCSDLNTVTPSASEETAEVKGERTKGQRGRTKGSDRSARIGEKKYCDKFSDKHASKFCVDFSNSPTCLSAVFSMLFKEVDVCQLLPW